MLKTPPIEMIHAYVLFSPLLGQFYSTLSHANSKWEISITQSKQQHSTTYKHKMNVKMDKNACVSSQKML